jgi:hypothetical protein
MKERRHFIRILFPALLCIILVSCSANNNADEQASVRLNIARQDLAGCASEAINDAYLFLGHSLDAKVARKRIMLTVTANDQVFVSLGINVNRQLTDKTLESVLRILQDVQIANNEAVGFALGLYTGFLFPPQMPSGFEARKDASGTYHFYSSSQEVSPQQVLHAFQAQIGAGIEEAETILINWTNAHLSKLSKSRKKNPSSVPKVGE